MYLSKLKLWNFRQFGINDDNLERNPDLVVSFKEGLNLLVGENDSGKSTIVEAINYIVFPYSHEYARIAPEDFYNDQEKLRIECEFSGFTLNEAKNFTEHLSFSDIDFVEMLEGGDKDKWLEENIKKFYLRLFLEAEKKDGNVRWYTIKTGVDDEGVIFDGQIRDFLKSMYLKPLRNAEYDLTARPRSRLSQVLAKHKHFKETNSNKHPLRTIFEDANKQVESFFDPDHPTEIRGKETHKEIHIHLKELFSQRKQKSAKFSISDPELEQVLQKLSIKLEERKSGLGGLNLLFIAVELLLLQRDDHPGLHLGIIEEAEAHLHTQAQLRVLKYLQKLTSESINPIQLILTTHSTQIASEVELKNLILLAQSKGKMRAFSMDEESTKLDKSDYSFLQRFLDSTKANLFFAEGVIIVEGPAENLLIPTIARIIERDLVDYGVSIVNVGHKGLFRYSRIFLRKDDTEDFLGIPVACVKDNDAKYKSSAQGLIIPSEKEIELLRQKNKLEGEEQSVKNFVSANKTLEFDIALDLNLRKEFYRAVLYARSARKEVGRISIPAEKMIKIHEQVEADFKKWESETPQKIAYEIYEKCKKNKTITSQFFAEILNDKLKNQDETFLNYVKGSPKLKYIIDAIKYVTNLD